jgi:hypothetical protein
MGPIARESDRHALKIRQQALGLNLIVTDTRLIKATNLALNITKTNEIVNKNSKTDKMTVVVKAMKGVGSKYSNTRNSSFGKMLNKPNKWLKLEIKESKQI